MLFALANPCLAQDSAFFHNRWADSVRQLFQDQYSISSYVSAFNLDAAGKKNLDEVFKMDTGKLLKALMPQVPNNSLIPHGRVLIFTGGHISYNWNYRSNIDTPFTEARISQHLVDSRLNFTVAQTIPLVVSYFGRESNSKYFKDYRDLRIELNAEAFRQIRTNKITGYLTKALEQLRDPYLKPSLDFSNLQVDKMNKLLDGPDLVNRLIKARSVILNGGTIDTANFKKDATTINAAKEFLLYYDNLQKKKQKLAAFRDSLQTEFAAKEKQLRSIKKIISSNSSDEEKMKALADLPGQSIKTQIPKRYNLLSSIKTFALGKTLPSYSDLTLKNINVNGVNFEYNRKFYFAFTAGAIEYRARDFFYSSQKRKPQFIYALRFGYGSKEGSHTFLTAYRGKKQILSTSANSNTTSVYGLSLESQLVINKNHRILSEIAQSASSSLIPAPVNEKPSFKLKDEKNKAWSIKLNSWFPKTRSRFEAFYKYRGIDFQNFSSYYANAAQTSWYIKVDQYLWKRQLRINLSINKSNFENSYLPLRYNGKNTYQSFAVFFKKAKWPSMQLGYMPASQLSDVNGQVYENFYHTLNFSATHRYKIGLAQALSVFSFNRFYNSSRDSGFIYYNAKNYYFSQHMQFASYAASVNITRTSSRDYTLTVFEAGTTAKISGQSMLGFGVKINQLNDQLLKVGFYGSEHIFIKNIGEINAWIEKAYLPGTKGNLVKNDLYNIGFTRFLK